MEGGGGGEGEEEEEEKEGDTGGTVIQGCRCGGNSDTDTWLVLGLRTSSLELTVPSEEFKCPAPFRCFLYFFILAR